MQGGEDLRTDFAIIGFPRCGASPLAAMLEASPTLHVARMNDKLEAPFLLPDREGDPPVYVPGKLNGHKSSAYISRASNLLALERHNSRMNLIVIVRNASEVLVSMREMHRQMAIRNIPNHFVTRDEASREFYATASLDDYYRAYASRQLDHARVLQRVRDTVPSMKVMVISHARLLEDPRDALRKLHFSLLTIPLGAMEALSPHDSAARRELATAEIGEEVRACLQEHDDKLLAAIIGIKPSCTILGEEKPL